MPVNKFTDFEAAFRALDDLLGRHRLKLHVIICGGYLIQQMGFRGTLDVDAFYNSNDEIDLLIRRVGSLLDINSENTLWLNNAVSAVSDWPASEHCISLYQFDNLTVDQVTVEYLMGMKLTAARTVDTQDVGLIIKAKQLDDPIGLYQQLTGMGFEFSMVSLLDAFAFAYGDEWRATYWNEHSKDILSLINSNW